MLSFYSYYRVYFVLFGLLSTESSQRREIFDTSNIKTYTTPLGLVREMAIPPKEIVDNFQKAKTKYYSNINNVENIIWYGRRAGYLCDYEKAIEIFTEGIKRHPKDSRLYRHRGHRYISIRSLDDAITDLKYASELIKDQPNEMEPDGAPNAKNIPVSSRHGNIWYHLGLAYYLKGDMEKAFEAYINSRNSGNNDDNLVASTRWLYMIQRRLGNKELADSLLEPIHNSMEVIENSNYYDLCKFYKGLIPVDSLKSKIDGPMGSASLYGIANWHFYNGNKEEALEIISEILSGPDWNSFGYIAAEADYANLYKHEGYALRLK